MVLKAFIGALYMDAGMDFVKTTIMDLWSDFLEDMDFLKKRDAKSMLQEWSQKHGRGLPIYEVIEVQGKAHNPLFTMKVVVENESALGIGASKKKAEYNAARALMDILQIS